MLNHTFYHSLTRKYISAFGNLFNEIFIRRVNSEGTRVQTIPVPIRYSQKSRWMEQLLNDPQEQKVALSLPFIAFQKTGFSYDPSRQSDPNLKISMVSATDENRRNLVFNLVPYKLNFEMTVVARNQDDMCQILEQILPYFTPNHTNTVMLVPEIKLSRDINFALTGINSEDSFEGDFKGDSRRVMETLTFEADIWFIGPLSSQGVIKRIILNFSDDLTNRKIDERIIIQPGLTIDGKPTTIKEESIPYREIEKMDDYGFIEEWTTLDPEQDELDYPTE